MTLETENLDEQSMQQLEERIPEFAGMAFKQACARALDSGGKVLQAIDGKLVEVSQDGSTRVVKTLPPLISVAVGSIRIRRPVQ